MAQPAPNYGYAAPGYPPPGYQPPPPGYPPPGYPSAEPPPPGYDPNVYPGYSYNDGSPTLFVEGAVVPLVVVGGAWGYYDAHHYWHHAPEPVARNLEQRHAEYHPVGGGYPPPRTPDGGYPPPRSPNGVYPQARPVAGGDPYRGQPQYRPPPPPPPQAHPAPQAEHQEHPHSHDCPPGQRC